MKSTDDPRNIFVDNRQGYRGGEEQSDGSGSRSEHGNGTDNTNRSTSRQQPSSDGGTDYDSKVAEMKRLAAKYQREGEGQLVRDIVNNVIEQKAAGKLSNEQLVQFANRVSPLLNAEQKQRLGELLQQLLKL